MTPEWARKALNVACQQTDGGTVLTVSTLVLHRDGTLVSYSVSDDLEVTTIVVTDPAATIAAAQSGSAGYSVIDLDPL